MLNHPPQGSALGVSVWFLTAWQIMVMRRGPQDLPGSSQWTLVALGLYLLTGSILSGLRDLPHSLPGLLALDITVSVTFLTLLLIVLGRGMRLPQSLQALWLCGSFLNLAGMPFAPILAGAEENGGLWVEVAIIASLALLFWSVAVLAQILRHALEWPFNRALAMAILYSLINIMSTLYVFPPSVPANG